MVSVLIPVYNRGLEIEILLNSFVNEYYTNNADFEVIVIDDISDDGTFEIVFQYSSKYDFIKLIKSGYRSPGMSRNLGSEVASNDWLLYCDSDNLMIPNWSVELKEILLKYSNFDGIWFPACCNNVVLTSSKYTLKGDHIISPYFYFNNYIGEVVHCVKRSFLVNNKYYYLKGTSNDFPDLLWFSLFSNSNYKVVFVNTIIQEYFMNSSDRISSDISVAKNNSQIMHYKLVLIQLLRSRYVFSWYFIKIVFKFFFFILIVDDRVVSLKNQIGFLRIISRFSFCFGLGNFLLKKLRERKNENIIR